MVRGSWHYLSDVAFVSSMTPPSMASKANLCIAKGQGNKAKTALKKMTTYVSDALSVSKQESITPSPSTMSSTAILRGSVRVSVGVRVWVRVGTYVAEVNSVVSVIGGGGMSSLRLLIFIGEGGMSVAHLVVG